MLKNNVLEAIDIIAQQKTRTAGYDRTIQASIVKCNDSVIGSYDIKYQGEILRAYSINKGIEYQKDKKVIVLIPGNNFNNEKIILGQVDKDTSTYMKRTENEYLSNDYNIFNQIKDIELCSYKTEERELLRRNNGDIDDKDYLLKDNFKNSLQDSSHICISFDIQTKIPAEQRDNRGDYGLRFYLKFKKPGNTQKTEIKEYVFNTLKMTGSPYYYPNKITQRCFFTIDGSNFEDIEKIEVFVNSFTYQSSDKENDIFISNISLTGARKLSSEELSGATIAISSFKGYHFGQSINQLQIQAKLLILGKPVNQNEQNLEYYWFKRNMLVSSNSPEYLYYGKTGWACLNPALPVSDTINKFKSGSKTIKISKDLNYSPTNLYKCVIVKGNEIISKEFTLYNDEANYQIEVSFPNISNPNIIQKRNGYINIECETNSYPTVLCKVINNSGEQVSYTTYETDANPGNCFWKCFDADGIEKNTQFGTDDDIEDFINNRNYLEEIQNLKEGLENGSLVQQSIVNGENVKNRLERLQNYKTAEKPQTQYLNGIYNIHVSRIDDFNTFGFSFTDGQGQILAECEIVVSNQNTSSKYHLILQNGSQSFIYNEDGIKPTAAPLTLTYRLLDGNGMEVDKNLISTSWKVPLNNTLLEVNLDNNLDQKANLLDPNNKYYLNLSQLPIDIAENYQINKKNNDIQLVVDYNHYKLSATTNFTFVKQGQNGTNGTGAVLILSAYKGDTFVPTPCLSMGKANFDHIKARFFENSNQITSINSTWFYLTDTSTSQLIKINSNQLLVDQINKDSYKVIKAEVERYGLKYYATLPIIYSSTPNFYLEDNSGYMQVIYAEDGTRPQYDNNSNFILKLVDDNYGDITLANKAMVGGKQIITEYKFEDSSNNFIKQETSTFLPKNTFKILPPNNYINDTTCIIPLTFTVKYLEKQQILQIPIHLMLNRYGHAALNDWDGNSISTDRGDIILAPQVGAGRKTDKNGFTGVLMAAVQNKDGNIETGLFGYSNGERSIFLDSQTGNATFGKPGAAQIKIDATSNEGTISSHDYSNNKGMKIKFSSTGEGEDLGPYIKFGSGHFSVDNQGNLVAKGGGSIAGWQISDTALTKEKVGMGSDPTGKAFWAGDNFTVDFEGNLHSSAGDIAGWKITDDELSKDNVGMSSNSNKNAFFSGDNFYVTHDGKLFSKDGQIANWTITENALYSGDKSSFREKTTPQESVVGIYLGPEGISLGDFTGQGNAFQVNNNGDLKARRGQIANWNISNNAFYTGDIEPYTSDNVPTGQDADKDLTGQLYFGRAGLALGKNFSVNPNGNLYAISGNLGGIQLTNDGIRANNFSIDGSGNAEFTSCKIGGQSVITNANISGGSIGSGSGGYTSLGNLGTTNALSRNAPMDNGDSLYKWVGDIAAGKITADSIISKLSHANLGIVNKISIGHEISVDSDATIHFYGWSNGDFLVSLSNRFQNIEEDIREIKRHLPSSGN